MKRRTLCLAVLGCLWATTVYLAGADRATHGALRRWLSFKARGYVTLDGLRIYLDPNDLLMTGFLIDRGDHDPVFSHFLRHTVHPGDTVVDVGAHIGYYTALLARAVGPQGRVFAFEPDPTSFSYLVRNVTANGFRNVIPEQKAVSARRTALTLYLSPVNTGDHRTVPAEESRQTIPIRAVSLDEYFDSDIAIQFIKVDTQGHEVAILSGMSRILATQDQLRLALEFWPYGLCRAGTSAEELLRHFPSPPWRLYDADERRGGVFQATPSQLLARYTVSNTYSTNIFLTRSP